MIQVDKLSFTYPKNKKPSIDNISFKINKGEIFGFLGPSGAGKSTTQKLLIKLLSNYTGDIEILNKKLNNWKSDYFEHIGVGFELPNHYLKLTAIENLRFFDVFYSHKTIAPETLLEQVGLSEAKNKPVAEFSKGMKMRLNFIRAIMHNPQILFFDEPTSGLDPANARNLKNIILKQKNAGKTIFITTHNMHDAEELCDRVAFIVNGRIAVCDTPGNLRLSGSKKKVKIEYNEENRIKTEIFDMHNLSENNKFQQILKSGDLLSIHSEEATLEEVFMDVTGHKLYN